MILTIIFLTFSYGLVVGGITMVLLHNPPGHPREWEISTICTIILLIVISPFTVVLFVTYLILSKLIDSENNRTTNKKSKSVDTDKNNNMFGGIF